MAILPASLALSMATASTVSWSPNSDRLAFESNVRSICTVGVDHDDVETWSSLPSTAAQRGSDLAWSPDGEAIAVAGQSGMLLLAHDGTSDSWPKAGATLNLGAEWSLKRLSSPAWSRDGRELSCLGEFGPPAASAVLTISAGGLRADRVSSPIDLVDGSGKFGTYIREFALSPDNDTILVLASFRPLVAPITAPRPPALMATDRAGLISLRAHRLDLLGPEGLVAPRPPRGNETAPAPRQIRCVRLTPDGRTVMFAEDCAGFSYVWACKLDGSGQRLLHDQAFTGLVDLQCSPDGLHLATASATGLEVWDLGLTERRLLVPTELMHLSGEPTGDSAA